MRIGTIILCRFSSTRLPGKILKPLHGKPVLSYLYEKFARLVDQPKDLLVCTSTESSDDIIADFCKEHRMNVFRGSLENVADRFLQASKHMGYDYAVRINGDALFVDTHTYRDMLDLCKANDYDFVSNVKGRSFPFGMSVEVVRTAFYEAIQETIQSSDRYREHVTLCLYENEDLGKQYHHKNTVAPDLAGLDIALDEPKDWELYQEVMKKIGEDFYSCDLKHFESIIESIKNEYKLAGKTWAFTHS